MLHITELYSLKTAASESWQFVHRFLLWAEPQKKGLYNDQWLMNGGWLQGPRRGKVVKQVPGPSTSRRGNWRSAHLQRSSGKVWGRGWGMGGGPMWGWAGLLKPVSALRSLSELDSERKVDSPAVNFYRHHYRWII